MNYAAPVCPLLKQAGHCMRSHGRLLSPDHLSSQTDPAGRRRPQIVEEVNVPEENVRVNVSVGTSGTL